MLKTFIDRFSSRDDLPKRSRCREGIFSSQCFEGFINNKLRHLDIQGGLIFRSNSPFDCSVLRPRLIHRSSSAGDETYASVQYLQFLPGGNRLLCLEVKALMSTDGQTWHRSLPLSQILIYRCGMGLGHKYAQATSYDFENVSSNIFPEHSYALDFLAIFCADLSNSGDYLAVCGVNKNNKKHMITVYKIFVLKRDRCLKNVKELQGSAVTIEEIACYNLDGSGVLSAKITACKFSPDASLLVTSVCNDFFLNSRQNYIDFWNCKSKVRIGRLDPTILCKQSHRTPRGYISSISFSPDGDIVVFCTSALQVLLYSVNKSTFANVIYSTKTPSEFREEKWQPVFSCWTPTFGAYDFVVCSQDGTLTRYWLDHKNLSLYMRSQSNVFKDTHMLRLFVYGIEFCTAISKLFIRVSYDETVSYDLLTDSVEQRLVSNTFSSRDAQRMLAGSVNTSTAISRHGEEIATSAGETINIFLLSQQGFSLKSLCRDFVVKLIPEDCILELPLPKCLLSYLMYDRYVPNQLEGSVTFH